MMQLEPHGVIEGFRSSSRGPFEPETTVVVKASIVGIVKSWV